MIFFKELGFFKRIGIRFLLAKPDYSSLPPSFSNCIITLGGGNWGTGHLSGKKDVWDSGWGFASKKLEASNPLKAILQHKYNKTFSEWQQSSSHGCMAVSLHRQVYNAYHNSWPTTHIILPMFCCPVESSSRGWWLVKWHVLLSQSLFLSSAFRPHSRLPSCLSLLVAKSVNVDTAPSSEGTMFAFLNHNKTENFVVHLQLRQLSKLPPTHTSESLFSIWGAEEAPGNWLILYWRTQTLLGCHNTWLSRSVGEG